MNCDELEEQKKTNVLLGNLISEVVQIKFELINERLQRERAPVYDPKVLFSPDCSRGGLGVGIPVDLGTGGQYTIVVPGEE